MAKQEHFDILTEGRDTWNAWRADHPEITPHLSKISLTVDLSGFNLSGADLSRVELKSSGFINANLSGANLRKSILTYSKLDRADLSGADLSGVELKSSGFIDANLSGANLRGSTLACSDLSGADLSGADLTGVNFRSSGLVDANLSGADLRQADLTHSDLRRAILKGVDLRSAILNGVNLSKMILSGVNLSEVHLSEANLTEANLSRANLRKANLTGARLFKADLSGADLRDAVLTYAELSGANLSDAKCAGAKLIEADLREANLSGKTDLSGADLSGAVLVGTDLRGAILTDCAIYGISAWDVQLEGATQHSLVVTPGGQPAVRVDNLKVAQFVYLLLANAEIREAIDTIGQKGVLILGRFTPERKAVLDALREKLRSLDFLPIVFDFERPTQRDFTETIMTLAGLSCFIIADITKPKSSPLELQAVVPNYMIPLVPIIEKGEPPFAMFEDLQRKYHWVLKTLDYDTPSHLIQGFEKAVVKQALEMRAKLLDEKVETLQTRHIEDYLS